MALVLRVPPGPDAQVLRAAVDSASRWGAVALEGPGGSPAADAVLAVAAPAHDDLPGLPVLLVMGLPGTPGTAAGDVADVGPDAVAVRAVVLPGDGAGPRTVTGVVGRRDDDAATAAAVVRVLPALWRQAVAAGGPWAPAELAQVAAAPAGAAPAPSSAATDGALMRLRRWLYDRLVVVDWRVGLLPGVGIDDAIADPGRPIHVRWARGRSSRYRADPCPVVDASGRTWVFVEEYARREGRGRVLALRWEAGEVAEERVVLDDVHHRALPRARCHGSTWWATVDTCRSPAEVFTFGAPGDPWVRLPEALLPDFLTDPDLVPDGDGWVVVGSSWQLDEDAVCETWRSATGPPFAWVRDDAAGYVDVRAARGGGNLDPGRGVRAVQDCAAAYGAAVSLVGPPGTDGAPGAARLRWDGSSVVGDRPRGMHTLAWTDDGAVVVVDGWWRRLHPLAWWWRRRDLRHLRACRAERVEAERVATGRIEAERQRPAG